jgi:integrase
MSDNLLIYKGKNKTTYYYRTIIDGKRKKLNFGHDLVIALQKVREFETTGNIAPKQLYQIWEHYKYSALLERSVGTQKDYIRAWEMIDPIMGHAVLEAIRPVHLKQYCTSREGKVRANREKALISILFNYARERGFFDGANPCAQVKGNKESGRDRYVEKWEYEEIYNCADSVTKDCMDLLLYTGQRVSDMLKMRRGDIKDNILWIHTSKTSKKVGIHIEGQLAVVIDRILNRDSSVKSLFLISNNDGQNLSIHTLEDKFKKARLLAGFKSFQIQLRDLRAKNASDDTLANANTRLTHTTTNMTDKYRRKHKGGTVMPLMKLI